MTTVIAIANTKGGSGKTTTVATLAAILAERQRVLMLDTDPQASLTQAVLPGAVGLTLADVLAKRVGMADAVVRLSDRLGIVPADQRLTATEHVLQTTPSGQHALSKALAPLAEWDLILVDTPPTLSQLVIGSLVAAQGVLITARPEANDVRALATFMQLLADVREIPSVNLDTVGIVAQMADTRSAVHLDGIEALRLYAPVIGIIGRTVRISEAAAALQTIKDYPDNPRADEYRALAKEITAWLKRYQ